MRYARPLTSLMVVFILLMASPSMAEPEPSPLQIEALPFSTTGATRPNTDALMEDIAPSEDIALQTTEKEGLPQFNTDTYSSQLFWLFIAFAVLYAFFSKSTLPKLSSVMEDRMMTIRGDLEEAENMSRKAEETRQAYEESITGAHSEAKAFLHDITESLRQDAEGEGDSFKQKSAAEIAKLEKEADRAVNAIKDDLTETVTDITSDIVNKLSGLSLKQADIKKTVTAHMGRDKVA